LPPRASVMVRDGRGGRRPGIGGLLKLPAPSHCLCPSFRSRSQSWTTPSSGSRFQNVVKAHPGWISSFCCAFIGYARAPRKRVVGINNNASIIIYDNIVMMPAKNKTARVRTVLWTRRDYDCCNDVQGVYGCSHSSQRLSFSFLPNRFFENYDTYTIHKSSPLVVNNKLYYRLA